MSQTPVPPHSQFFEFFGHFTFGHFTFTYDKGEVGHMVGPPVVAQVLVDDVDVVGQRHGKHPGLTESKPTPRAQQLYSFH